MSKWIRSVNPRITQLVIVQDGDQERSYCCNSAGTEWIKIIDSNTAGRVSPEEEEELQGLYHEHLNIGKKPQKFCKDCKYFWEGSYNLWCKSPNTGIDLVTGEPDWKSAERMRGSDEFCSREAKWFVQKKPEVKRKWWKLWSC